MLDWDENIALDPAISNADQSDSKLGSYHRETKQVSPTIVLMILILLAVAQMVQYCVMSLTCAKIPGNKYWNGVLFGTGELMGMIFT